MKAISRIQNRPQLMILSILPTSLLYISVITKSKFSIRREPLVRIEAIFFLNFKIVSVLDCGDGLFVKEIFNYKINFAIYIVNISGFSIMNSIV